MLYLSCSWVFNVFSFHLASSSPVSFFCYLFLHDHSIIRWLWGIYSFTDNLKVRQRSCTTRHQAVSEGPGVRLVTFWSASSLLQSLSHHKNILTPTHLQIFGLTTLEELLPKLQLVWLGSKSPVHSSLFSFLGWTVDWTSSIKGNVLKKLDWTGADWSTSVWYWTGSN